MEFKPDETYHALLSGSIEIKKIHIMYVLDSIYENEKLIVFRWYGKHKQWWHEEMLNSERLSMYIKMAIKN